MRWLFLSLIGLAIFSLPAKTAFAQQRAESGDAVMKLSFAQLATGEARILDLTHALNDQSPFWPAENYQPFQLRTIATLEKNGVLSKEFSMPEHFGTHLDAPNHFETGQPSVEQIAVGDLFAPGVMLDVTLASEADADYRLTLADVRAWEKTHGPIPPRAIVLLKTGWGRFWNSNARYRNQDAAGKMHFPGYSAEAAEWLVKERNIRGLGIDTLSIDHGPSKDFVVHHIVNKAGRYGLENVAQLDKLPARDFFLIVAPIKIMSGSGGPTRIFAILPDKQ